MSNPTDGERVKVSTPRVRGKRCRRRRLAILCKRAAFAGLGVLGALLLCEIGVRLFVPQGLFPRYVTDGGFGIRVNVPDARYWHTSPEMRVQFRINSMGMRSDCEYVFEKPGDVVRIVFLGDSFTQGYEVNVGEAYVYRVEEMLRSEGLDVEAINLGVSGHGTAEELLMLEHFGLRFEPDVVVVGYFQNDPDDNIRSELFRLDESGALVRKRESYLPAIGIRDTLYSLAVYRWLAENSQLFSLFRESLALRVKRKMIESRAAHTPDPKAGTQPNTQSGLLTARLLDRMKAACSGRGVRFLILDIPGHRLTDSNLPVELLELVEPDEIVRPLGELRARPPGAYLYRKKGHRHWTPEAHQIAAELFARRLSIPAAGE